MAQVAALQINPYFPDTVHLSARIFYVFSDSQNLTIISGTTQMLPPTGSLP